MMMSLWRSPQFSRDVVDRPLRDAYLPLRSTRLAFLVDGQHDHRRTMLGDQLHDPAESRVGPVAVLVVGGVDHRASTETFQACLQHRRLGGVQHDGQRRSRRQPEGQLSHVGDAVSADVVDIEIEHVGAVADLGPRDVDAVVPALGQQRLAERLRPVGVGPFPDRQVADVLAERHLGVQGGRGRDVAR